MRFDFFGLPDQESRLKLGFPKNKNRLFQMRWVQNPAQQFFIKKIFSISKENMQYKVLHDHRGVLMPKGITTSARLTPELRQQLDYLSHSLHRGKNWIVIQALQEFINKNNYALLAEEAKRQSLLASQYETNEDEDIGEENIDTTGCQS